ncbi:hypothetical protein D920_00457 [Enterococcus faecalis 13-SD-W-01]|nr:hypothetical protein D920_00457 [Enterococcus faecalis 13-SD-W-01]
MKHNRKNTLRFASANNEVCFFLSVSLKSKSKRSCGIYPTTGFFAFLSLK